MNKILSGIAPPMGNPEVATRKLHCRTRSIRQPRLQSVARRNSTRSLASPRISLFLPKPKRADHQPIIRRLNRLHTVLTANEACYYVIKPVCCIPLSMSILPSTLLFIYCLKPRTLPVYSPLRTWQRTPLARASILRESYLGTASPVLGQPRRDAIISRQRAP